MACGGVMKKVKDEGEFIGEGMDSLHLFQTSPITIGERQVVIKENISSVNSPSSSTVAHQ